MDHPNMTALQNPEPEWFRLGRDAVNVMTRLTGMKELDFYLRHPESFIRLHAIRRIASLLLPDAIPNLTKVLDDPLENEQNRDEAGWAIRRISMARNLSCFSHHAHTDRYDGSEPATGRYGITVVETDDGSSPAAADDISDDTHVEDEVLLRIQMEEKRVFVAFSPFAWIGSNFRYLLHGLAFGFLILLKRLLSGIFTLLKKLFSGMHHLFSSGVHTLACRKKKDTHALRDHHQKSLAGEMDTPHPVILIGLAETASALPAGKVTATYRSGKVTAISRTGASAIHPGQFAGLARKTSSIHAKRRRYKGGVPMFKLLFYPIRLVRQHWLFSLAILAALYLMLGFSQFGRTFVHRTNPLAQTYNDRFVAATRAAAIHFFGIETVADKNPAANAGIPGTVETSILTAGKTGKQALASTPPANPMFRVSAAKGLNLRTEPLQTSPRIVFMPMATDVGYEGVRKSDPAGSEWMLVSYDGKTGWAMSKWLSPVEVGNGNGGSDGKP